MVYNNSQVKKIEQQKKIGECWGVKIMAILSGMARVNLIEKVTFESIHEESEEVITWLFKEEYPRQSLCNGPEVESMWHVPGRTKRQ